MFDNGDGLHEDSDDPSNSNFSGDDPTNDSFVFFTLNSFEEHEEVISNINNLPVLCDPDSGCDIRGVERAYERMKFILSRYKEQPHLLDNFLEKMLSDIVALVVNEDMPMSVKHNAFKYMFLIVNVRGYKEVIQYLPHKVS